MSSLKFSDLSLGPALQTALRESQYHTPTPIQQQAIPLILEGHDLLGIAQTGTGKTAAFSLPMLEILSKTGWNRQARHPRALILTPTRELALQIHQSLRTYGKNLKLRYSVIFGGVGQNPQVRELALGVDILVATPGRLLDLIQQKHVFLNKVEMFVLDEADRMLDMGFMPDIKRILPLLPTERHNLFFSATMPPEIRRLSETILRNPRKVEVTPAATTVEKIEQSALFVEKKDKVPLLLHLLKKDEFTKVLVFVEMKHVANRVVEKLLAHRISAAAIHGNKSQNARQKALRDFEEGSAQVLVATDIASRGIDIDGVTHVINLELSHLPESYVHRIGRTARAGASGKALSFCTAEEKSYLFAIEKVTRQKIFVETDHPFHSESAAQSAVVSLGKAKAQIEGRRGDGPRPSRFNKFRRFGGPKRGNKKFEGVSKRP